MLWNFLDLNIDTKSKTSVSIERKREGYESKASSSLRSDDNEFVNEFLRYIVASSPA